MNPRISSAVFLVLLIALALEGSGTTTLAVNGGKLYDETADGAEQISRALALAKKSDRNILLEFGANWCGWCFRLHNLFEANETIAQNLSSNFVVVQIDVNEGHNRNLVARYGAEQGFGLPFIVILDGDGRWWMTKAVDDWVLGDGYSPKLVLDFLKKWAPDVVKGTKPSNWVEEFVQMDDSTFDPKCLEFQRIRGLGAGAVNALVDVIRGESAVADTNRAMSARIRAHWAIQELGPCAKLAVPCLIEEFRTNPRMRNWASDTLARLGPDAGAAVPALLEAFRSNDARLQTGAGFALAHIAPSTPELTSNLRLWLSSPDVVRRRGAALILVELGSAGVTALPELKTACEDSDETVRKRALAALGKMGFGTASSQSR